MPPFFIPSAPLIALHQAPQHTSTVAGMETPKTLTSSNLKNYPYEQDAPET